MGKKQQKQEDPTKTYEGPLRRHNHSYGHAHHNDGKGCGVQMRMPTERFVEDDQGNVIGREPITEGTPGAFGNLYRR